MRRIPFDPVAVSQMSDEQRFFEFLGRGMLDELREMVFNDGFDMRGTMRGPSDALFTAIWIGEHRSDRNMPVIRFLVEQGDDVNGFTMGFHDIQQTALHLACEMGNLELVQLLVENGADVNIQSETGLTSVHHCVYPAYFPAFSDSTLPIIRYLVEVGGADLDIPDNDGLTPLACARRNERVVDQASPLVLRQVMRYLESGIPIVTPMMRLDERLGLWRQFTAKAILSELEQHVPQAVAFRILAFLAISDLERPLPELSDSAASTASRTASRGGWCSKCLCWL